MWTCVCGVLVVGGEWNGGLFIAVKIYITKTANCDTDAKSKTNFEH